jgi:hypothetical protein
MSLILGSSVTLAWVNSEDTTAAVREVFVRVLAEGVALLGT